MLMQALEKKVIPPEPAYGVSISPMAKYMWPHFRIGQPTTNANHTAHGMNKNNIGMERDGEQTETPNAPQPRLLNTRW